MKADPNPHPAAPAPGLREERPPDAVWRRAAMISRLGMYLAGAATAGLSAWGLSRGASARRAVMISMAVMLMCGFATLLFSVAVALSRRLRPRRRSAGVSP